jgi:hypothetical protein
MKKFTHLITLFLALFLLAPNHLLFSQGVFTSAATGNWNVAATWTFTGTDVDGIPDADDNVTIGAHVITVTQLEACNNLTHPGGSTTRLICGANTLEINGTLTFATAPTGDLYITSTSDLGRIKFVGGARTLFATSAAFGNGYDVEVALTGSSVGTATTNLKFRNVFITSGVFNITGDLRIDGGANGSGKLTIGANGTLIGSSVIGARSGTASSHCGTITVDGVLETAGTRLNGLNININGTLRIKNTLGLLASDPSGITDPEFAYGAASNVEYAASGNMSMGVETGRASGTADPIINEMKINVPAANTVSTNFKLPQIKTLNFLSGKVNANSRVTLIAGGTITGASSARYVIATSSTATLRRLGVDATTVDFHVGTSTVYLPITAFSNSGTSDDFSVFVAAAVPACVTTPASGAVTATWDISELVAGGSNCSMTLDFTNASVTGTLNGTATIGHCTGTVTDYTNGTVTGTTASGTGFTTFSPFAVANLAALPIELKSFTGKTLKSTNLVEWVTATEVDVKEHIIERSINGSTDWTLVGSTPSKGNARTDQPYSLEDTKPLTKSFYRLRTLDLDGREQFSNVISLTRQNNSFGVIAAYPNPAVEMINVQFNTLEEGNITARIVDMTGRLVLEQQMSALNGTNMFPVQLHGLSAGTYFITLSSDNEVAEPIRFVKQ